MDLVAKHAGDDLDLDALMIRVREAAMAGGTSGGAARPQSGGAANGAALDLARVLDAQAEWNEQARQSLAALLDCLQTLRDDWLDAHARLREDVEHLSALVGELRKAKGGRGAKGSARAAAKRQSSKRGRRRS